jgi:hypothetical protein
MSTLIRFLLLLALAVASVSAREMGATPRRSITFILGEDEDPSLPVYHLAEMHFREDPLDRTDDVVNTARSLEAVRNHLIQQAPADGNPWGLVNLVVHGREGLLDVPIRSGAAGATTESLREALEKRPFQPVPDAILDGRSEIRIHGCDVGRDPLLLGYLSRLFGGTDPLRPLVRGSRYFTCFQEEASPGLIPQRFLTEAWSLAFRPGERPAARNLAARFKARFPHMDVKVEDALSHTISRFKGDAFSYESGMRFRWTLVCPPGNSPSLPRGRNQILVWIRAQEELLKHLMNLGVDPEDLHWELNLARYNHLGTEYPAISALGIGRRVYVLRPLNLPDSGAAAVFQDARYFSSAK